MSSKQYDIVVLGGGTGGYVAAVRAAQHGKTVAIVERDKLGGTCLHRGCIPSKALLRSAEVLATMKRGEEYGIALGGPVSLDFGKVQHRKSAIVEQLHKGVQFLMKKYSIDVYRGNGRLIGPSIFSPRSGTVSVEVAEGEIENLVPQHLIIATGSHPRTLPGLEIDGELVLTSEEALELEQLPKSLVIVGGGVIGVEWASMMNDFGVDVTIVEFEKRLVPLEDADVSRELERLFKKRGIRVLTGAKLLPETLVKDGGTARVQAEQNGAALQLEADKLLVSVGRAGNVDGFGLEENTDVKVERGLIKVNEHFQTTEGHIYAIGDVIGGLQLAHAAMHEAVAAVDRICGEEPHTYEPHLVPRCIYTRPEIASVGWTEEQAKQRGYEVKTGKFSFKAIGKALVHGEADGFVKVVADARTKDVLGVHMIGPHVTDMISEAALAQLLNAASWEVGMTIHPHPTLSEALGEAMLAVDGKSTSM
ncbi:dihydrolipoamide dehydrogenase [Gordoniibacillus kamchatkensis]|uniref:Dihydrolipoyl dehydrogenase n=1 Tax=Gordoniibacillus kamchatkensis TaxID=1590651 RepID=A0ABR5ABY7_9BACL|nr:dihydrolipoyl dehydrogenase [Paenibacillus sp. VKM B-2647]KIL38480.1 dihydrolipoamide dehydrogenase [Paenibacillus sp. VKM B-2647]